MSVGSLKRLLIFVNLAAVLGLSGTAFGFWSHRRTLAEQRKWPDFTIAAVRGTGAGDVGKIKNLNLTLGKFPVEKKPAEATEPEKPTEEILSVIARMGEIIGAVVFYPPYDNASGFKPSISFKLKAGGEIVTIAMGEALETRDHPDLGKAYQVPHLYQFVGCERDPKDRNVTYFRFDMKLERDDTGSIWVTDSEAAEESGTSDEA